MPSFRLQDEDGKRRTRGCWFLARTHLAEAMERALEDQGDEDDDGAHRRHDPRRNALERRRLLSIIAAAAARSSLA
jgi:hypothetical protein